MDNAQTPQRIQTRWPVEIVHGTASTTGGERGGWGWECHAHHAPAARHGYETIEAATADLVAHLKRCPGHG